MQRSREGDADQVRDEEHIYDVVSTQSHLPGILEKLEESAAARKKGRRRPPEMGEDEEERDVGKEEQKLKVAVEEQPLGNAPPIHRPLVQELSRELERAENVAARIVEQERSAEQQLQKSAEEDEEEKTAPTHFVEQDQPETGAEEKNVHLQRDGETGVGGGRKRVLHHIIVKQQ